MHGEFSGLIGVSKYTRTCALLSLSKHSRYLAALEQQQVSVVCHSSNVRSIDRSPANPSPAKKRDRDVSTPLDFHIFFLPSFPNCPSVRLLSGVLSSASILLSLPWSLSLFLPFSSFSPSSGLSGRFRNLPSNSISSLLTRSNET